MLASTRDVACALDDSPNALAENASPSAELAWQTPAESSCSTREQIESRVAGLTSQRLAPAEARQRLPRIQVDLQREASTWRAQVRAFDAGGRALGARELLGKSPDCRSLDVALALVIATLVDAFPAALAATSSGVPAAESGKALAARGGRPEEAVGVGFGARLGIGLIPNAVFGLNLGVEIPVLGASVVVDGTAYLPYDDVDARGRGARLWPWHAGVGFCPRLVRGTVGLQVCGQVQLGAIHARGLGLDSSSTSQRLLVILGLEPKLGLRLADSFGLELSALGGWAPVRPEFTLGLGGSDLDTLRGAPFVLLLRIGIIGFFR